jgi:hypothetical protein
MKLVISIFFLLFIMSLTRVSNSEEEPTGNPEEISLTFKSKGVNRTLIECYYYNENIYLPVRNLFDIFMIDNELLPGEEMIKGYFIDKENEYEINFSSRLIILQGNEMNFGEFDFLNIEGEYFVRPEVLKRAFELDFRINMNKLAMSLITEKTLPLFRNIKRENVKKLLEKNNIQTPSFRFERNRSILNGGFFDYTVTSSHRKNFDPRYSYNFSLGNEILGGDLNANLSGDLSGDSNPYGDAMWRYVAENRVVNQVILGTNLSSQGILPTRYRGGTITNAPYGVRNEFSKYVLVDRTVPESDVELYMNNELIDYTTANEFGEFTFDIPLNYGTNVIELKIYSPQGELIEDNRQVQIPFDLLPDKEFQYSISGGLKDRSDNKAINGSFAFGLTSWLTNKTGVDFVEDSLFNKPVLYNSLSGRISDNYLFNLTAAPDLYYRFDFNASYLDRKSFNMRYTRFKQNALYNKNNIIDEYRVNSSIPYTMFDSRHGFRIGGSYSNAETFKKYRFDVSNEFSFLRIDPSLNFTYDEESGSSSYINKFITGGIRIPLYGLDELPFFNQKYIRARLTYDLIQKNVSFLNLAYSHSITRDFRVQFNYNRDFITRASFFNVQLQYDFPFAVVNTIGYKDGMDANIQGSIGFDGAGSRILSSRRKSIGTSGVSIRMFEDQNKNGKYEEGETVIDDANVRFKKNVKVEREEDGTLSAAFLGQYMEYEMDLNRLSAKNPLLVPKYGRIFLDTDPNSYKDVEIPFYETEEIYGYVVVNKDGETIPLSNINIDIVNNETGSNTKIESFSDGSIYYLGLLPGKYTAVLDTAQMNKMGTVSIPGKIEFEIGSEIVSNEEGRKLTELNFILNSKDQKNLADGIEIDSASTGSIFTVQLGAFRYYQNVLKFSNTLKTDLVIELDIHEFRDGLYKILSGEFKSADDARQFVSFIKGRGYDAFIRKAEEF